MNVISEFECEVCHCRVFEGEEEYKVFAKDRYWRICVLCGVSAEKLGWQLE